MKGTSRTQHRILMSTKLQGCKTILYLRRKSFTKFLRNKVVPYWSKLNAIRWKTPTIALRIFQKIFYGLLPEPSNLIFQHLDSASRFKMTTEMSYKYLELWRWPTPADSILSCHCKFVTRGSGRRKMELLNNVLEVWANYSRLSIADWPIWWANVFIYVCLWIRSPSFSPAESLCFQRPTNKFAPKFLTMFFFLDNDKR
jgi:hypothetical protein